jgi:hypothetical protein
MTTFTPYTYWTAWPNSGQTEDFARKSEATRHCALNGGGAIRKFRQISEYASGTKMDSLEIAAK